MSNKHPLDEWEDEAEKSRKSFIEDALRDTAMVYAVFATPHGEELLKRWMEVLMYSPTAQRGDDLLSIGMNEGYKSFVRTIIQAVKTHEDTQ